jgi:GNAT superfamily N-acetyltransferase
MDLSVCPAVEADIPAITSLRVAVADRLTSQYGQGHWSGAVTEQAVSRAVESSLVLVARKDSSIVATVRLTTKKPWAIDQAYFSEIRQPMYLHDMAVEPLLQSQGIGRRILEEAKSVAKAWPADGLRLDAYDSPAGAGGFYAKCGFREVGRATYRGVPLIYYELLLGDRVEPIE